MRKKNTNSFYYDDSANSYYFEKVYNDYISSLVTPYEVIPKDMTEIEPTGSNVESRLFASGDDLYKVLFAEYRTNDRLKAIKDFISSPIQYTPKIKALLVDSDGDFIGYKMEYLKDYMTLKEAHLSTLSNEERRSSARQSILSFKDFINRGYRYWDVHWHNIMVKSFESRFIDVDSVERFNDKSDIDYPLFSLINHLTNHIINTTYISYQELSILESILSDNVVAFECLSKTPRRVVGVKRFKDNVVDFNIDDALRTIDAFDDETIDKVRHVLKRS